MEQIEIERKTTRLTYLIKDTNMEFYLIIPASSKISIVLNLMENVSNDIVKNIPDIMDKVIVIPVLNNNVNSYLKSISVSYNSTDNYFSNLINTTYNILTHNKITVDKMIYLNNNKNFSNFQNYFINRFNGRVSLIDLGITASINPTISNTVIPELPQKEEPKPELPQELESIYSDEITLKEINQVKTTDDKEPGFVSYVLLGVVVAILTLVFLYLLL